MNCHNCLRYVAGLLAVFAYDDISYNKIATQSDTYNGMDYVASNAVDRNTTTCMRTDPIGVRNLDKTTWWKVDLGGVSSIYCVNIQFKSYDQYVDRQKGRLAGFSLYVSNSDVRFPDDIKKTTLCYKDGPELPPLNLTKVCSEYGRYVIFYNERLDGIVYPKGYEVTNVFTELCEVIVQENVLEIQSISSSIMLAIGLSVSILINIIFIVCGILLWRRKKPSKGTLFGNLLPRWKKSIYQDMVVKNDETSTYQELNLSDSAYQNTALPLSTKISLSCIIKPD